MSTALITGVIRQKVQDRIFFSTLFALRFHKNLSYVYTYFHSGGNENAVFSLININLLYHFKTGKLLLRIRRFPVLSHS